ncbi:beta-barrel fold lipoprotein [Sphingobacterium daejeonense]|uniref:Beta-barrel fold lipoprotein n=1 Tax=Sphingobacterium daejeonense TaxID=371142 RepID=A0ABW3RJJ0_9SPHI
MIRNMLTGILCLGFLFFSSCSKKDENSPESSLTKKIVEVRLTFSESYSNYSLVLGLQGTSVNGGLNENFNFIGANTTNENSIVLPESVIKTANYYVLTSSQLSIKTSHPVSTFSIAMTALNIREADNSEPLSVIIDFFIEGKKVNSKTTKFEANDFGSKVYAIHVAKPDKIIDSSEFN